MGTLYENSLDNCLSVCGLSGLGWLSWLAASRPLSYLLIFKYTPFSSLFFRFNKERCPY
jgi:hypothetical protein